MKSNKRKKCRMKYKDKYNGIQVEAMDNKKRPCEEDSELRIDTNDNTDEYGQPMCGLR